MLERIVAAMLVGTLSAACVSVKHVTAPGAFIETHHPPAVWVAAENGEVLRLNAPTVRGDSLVGTVEGTTEPVAIAISPKEPVYARQKDAVKTATLVGSIGLVGGLVVWGAVKGSSGPEDCTSLGASPTGRPYC